MKHSFITLYCLSIVSVLEENWPSVAAQGDKRLPAVEMNFQFILDISTITTVVTRGIFIRPEQIKRANWWHYWEGREVKFWAPHIQFMLDKDWYMVWNYSLSGFNPISVLPRASGSGNKAGKQIVIEAPALLGGKLGQVLLEQMLKVWGQQLQLHLWSINPATQRGAPRDPGAPCIENRGIEDNFIFYIECYFFFIRVRKYKCEFNISK